MHILLVLILSILPVERIVGESWDTPGRLEPRRLEPCSHTPTVGGSWDCLYRVQSKVLWLEATSFPGRERRLTDPHGILSPGTFLVSLLASPVLAVSSLIEGLTPKSYPERYDCPWKCPSILHQSCHLPQKKAAWDNTELDGSGPSQGRRRRYKEDPVAGRFHRTLDSGRDLGVGHATGRKARARGQMRNLGRSRLVYLKPMAFNISTAGVWHGQSIHLSSIPGLR